MEIVIKIPDEVLESRHYCQYFGAWSTKLTETIENGTPYNPSGDCISREALKETLRSYPQTDDMRTTELIGFFEKLIDNAQAIPLPSEQIAWEQGYEAGLAQGKQERPQGEWRNVVHGVLAYKACNKCNAEYPFDLTEDWILCPRCGAKIKGGAE